MHNNVKGVTEDKCCGCGACYQICPQKSIKMIENERGFLVPTIDAATCIECGACLKVCPEKVQPAFNVVRKSYAVIVNDDKLLKMSTSGGVFGMLATYIISIDGVVYGCAWNEEMVAQHKKIENIDELYQIQKSKYVQSDTNTTFSDVREMLKKGRPVLYSGTACQIGGLRNFLNGKEDGLITVEVACHGVPSPGLFRKYINWKSLIEKNQVIGIQFRNKEKHKKGEHYMFALSYENGKTRYYHSNEDSYYGSFLNGITLRETCYHCKYKEKYRVADILLSDYWGIEKEHKDFPAQHGVSAVVITSEKGEKIFENIRKNLIVENSTFEKITAHNKSIISCSKCEAERKLRSININSDLLFKELKPTVSIKNKIKNLVPENIKYYLKRF